MILVMIECLIIGDMESIDIISRFINEQCKFNVIGTANSYTELNLLDQDKSCLIYISAQMVFIHYNELQLIKHQHCFIVLYDETTERHHIDFGIGSLSALPTLDAFKDSLIQFGQYLDKPHQTDPLSPILN